MHASRGAVGAETRPRNLKTIFLSSVSLITRDMASCSGRRGGGVARKRLEAAASHLGVGLCSGPFMHHITATVPPSALTPEFMLGVCTVLLALACVRGFCVSLLSWFSFSFGNNCT